MKTRTFKQRHRWIIYQTAQYIKRTTEGGIFIECGVKQGGSSRVMATVLQRQGYLFDTWTGFPHYSKHDIPVGNAHRERRLKRRVKDNNSTYKECQFNLKKYGVLSLCKMIKGDICKTVPRFVKDCSLSICLMHIDTDLHDPADVSLQNFYPFLMKNGIILFHDYNDPKWPGIKCIVDSFVKEKKWDFVNMENINKTKVAAVINGDSSEYRDYILKKWKKTGEK